MHNPDNSPAQNFWLPIFAVLVGIYTVLGVGGLFLLTVNGGFSERAWVLLVFLIFATRDLGAVPATFAEFRRAYAG